MNSFTLAFLLSSRFKPWHVAALSGAVPGSSSRPVGGRCWCTSRSRCVATRTAVFATTGRRTPISKRRASRATPTPARFFNPMLVTFTGGEPTLSVVIPRKTSCSRSGSRDQSQVRHADHSQRDADAGARADRSGMPGSISSTFRSTIFDELAMMRRVVSQDSSTDSCRDPCDASAQNRQHRFNTVIHVSDNLDQILPMVRYAESVGVGVNFSVYTDAKNGNRDYLVGDRSYAELDEVVRELLAFKNRRRWHHHELGLLPGADSSLRARRAHRSRASRASARSTSTRQGR